MTDKPLAGTGPIGFLTRARPPLDQLPEEALPMISVGALMGASQLLRRWLDRWADADWGMTGPRVFLLGVIAHLPSLTMSEIADLMDVTPRAVTRLIDGLEASGHVTRTRDANDRRLVHVSRTQAAIEQAFELMPRHARRVAKLFEGYSAEEQRRLVEMLTTVGDRVRGELAEFPEPGPTLPEPVEGGSSGAGG